MSPLDILSQPKRVGFLPNNSLTTLLQAGSCFNKTARRTNSLVLAGSIPEVRSFTAMNQTHVPLGLTASPQANTVSPAANTIKSGFTSNQLLTTAYHNVGIAPKAFVHNGFPRKTIAGNFYLRFSSPLKPWVFPPFPHNTNDGTAKNSRSAVIHLECAFHRVKPLCHKIATSQSQTGNTGPLLFS